MLFTGPSGLGKTQMMLKFAESIALGKDFLGYDIAEPRKIVVLSLEMGHPDLKFFVQQQAEALSPSDLNILRENYIVIPHGEPWAFDKPLGQDRIRKVLEHYEPQGLFIDSVGSALSGSISQEEPVKAAMGFNDHLMRKYNIFTWWIHHMRKAQGDNKRPEQQDDVYGNQYLFNRASSVYGLFGKKHEDGTVTDLRVKNLKKRLAPIEKAFGVERTTNLGFQRTGTQPASDHIIKALQYSQPEYLKGPTTNSGESSDGNAGPLGPNKQSL
jgi:RecA-family ATPase